MTTVLSAQRAEIIASAGKVIVPNDGKVIHDGAMLPG
jgi:hypothetical protein